MRKIKGIPTDEQKIAQLEKVFVPITVYVLKEWVEGFEKKKATAFDFIYYQTSYLAPLKSETATEEVFGKYLSLRILENDSMADEFSESEEE